MHLIVARGATVYFDTNPLIYLTEANPALKARIGQLLTQLEAASAHYITSELALTEVLVHPLRHKNTPLVEAYARLFDSLVKPLPISRQVLILTAQLRADRPSLKTPDAIHIATATLAKADAFVSGDAGIGPLPALMQRFTL
jgi:predicted nucleic acid-binding protein